MRSLPILGVIIGLMDVCVLGGGGAQWLDQFCPDGILVEGAYTVNAGGCVGGYPCVKYVVNTKRKGA